MTDRSDFRNMSCRAGGQGRQGGHRRQNASAGQGRSNGGHDRSAPRAAVPFYVGTNFEQAPVGHRYLLYLPFWKNDWSAISSEKQKVLNEISKLRSPGVSLSHAEDIMSALSERQVNLGKAMNAVIISAVSISPFATGLGWEHPNENGFAFLQPYGLPYLAGSGIKGTARRAAQELAKEAHGNTQGWDNDSIDALFGPEPPPGSEEASRGALRFFDVIPEIAGDGMAVDIMNPHYGDYYQGNSNATPHDAGQPIPIFFLTVPVGSRFNFVVDCPRAHKLPASLKERWRELIRAAFEHAFAWLGFGAKTAVGYGAMKRDEEAEARRMRERHAEEKQRRKDEAERVSRAAEESRLAALSPLERTIKEVLREDRDPGKKDFVKLLEALKKGMWTGEEQRIVARQIEAEMQQHNKWKETSKKKNPQKDHDYQQTLEVMKFLREGGV